MKLWLLIFSIMSYYYDPIDIIDEKHWAPIETRGRFHRLAVCGGGLYLPRITKDTNTGSKRILVHTDDYSIKYVPISEIFSDVNKINKPVIYKIRECYYPKQVVDYQNTKMVWSKKPVNIIDKPDEFVHLSDNKIWLSCGEYKIKGEIVVPYRVKCIVFGVGSNMLSCMFRIYNASNDDIIYSSIIAHKSHDDIGITFNSDRFIVENSCFIELQFLANNIIPSFETSTKTCLTNIIIKKY